MAEKIEIRILDRRNVLELILVGSSCAIGGCGGSLGTASYVADELVPSYETWKIGIGDPQSPEMHDLQRNFKLLHENSRLARKAYESLSPEKQKMVAEYKKELKGLLRSRKSELGNNLRIVYKLFFEDVYKDRYGVEIDMDNPGFGDLIIMAIDRNYSDRRFQEIGNLKK